MMDIANLAKAVALEKALRALPGPAEIAQGGKLLVGDELAIDLAADDLAALIAARRGDIHRQLQALGIQPEGAAIAAVSDYAVQTPGIIRRDPALAIDSTPKTDAERAAPAALSRAEARDKAIDIIVEPRLVGHANMAHDPEQAEQDYRAERDRLAARHATEINTLTEALLAEPAAAARCADCAAVATTVVETLPYCAEHAASHRPARPELARRAS